MRRIQITQRHIFPPFILIAAAATLGIAAPLTVAAPPQTTMGSGFQNGSNSFFENVGVGFGFSIPSSMPGGHGSGVVGFSPAGGAGGNINFNGVGTVATPLSLGNNAGVLHSVTR